MKMKSKTNTALLALLLAMGTVGTALGANVEAKYSGPSGQGDVIWWAPKSGITNMVMTTNGLTHVTLYETPTIVDLTVKGSLTVGTNANISGAQTNTGAVRMKSTLQVDGIATLVGTPVLKDSITVETNGTFGGTVDAAAFTVDAGAGLDNQAAGALKLGAATATSVDIADTGVQVTNKGPLTVNEAFIAQSTARVVGVLTLNDSAVVGTNVDAASFTSDAGAGLDTQAAGALKLGAATATSVDIADTAVQVTNKGPLTVNEAFIAQTTAEIVGVATFDDSISVATNGTFGGAVTAATAHVTGAVILGDAVNVAGAVTFSNTLVCQGTNFHDKADKGSVWGAPSVTITTNSGTELVATVQAKTIAGGNLAERRLMRAYVSDTTAAPATTNNIEAMVLATGVAVDTVTANADYRYVSAAAGTFTITFTGTAADTHYVTVIDGASLTEAVMTFTGP